MTYVLNAVKHKPSALWLLDDTAPFQDYSGKNVSGTMAAGTAGTSSALVSGARSSTVFSSLNRGSFPTTVFRQGFESRSFTLESWVYVVSKGGADAPQQILSHLGQYDGLSVNGKVVSFSTKYLTTGEATVSFEVQSGRKLHVVGVHTPEKNILYINGVLAGEVEITEAQQADMYVATDGNLYTGNTTSTNQLAVNGHAVYPTALGPDEALAHYAAGSRTVPDNAVSNMFGGVPMTMNYNNGTIFHEAIWEGDSLLDGRFINTVLDNGILHPIVFNSVSQPGSWSNSFALDSANSATVYGVSLDWTGQGVVVEVSLDGIVWETVQKRKLVTTIPNNFNPTDKELQVRVSFPGGVTDDPAFVSRISIIGWLSASVPVYANRPVTLTYPAVLRGDAEMFEYREDAGLYLGSGSITVGADVSPDPVQPRTIELWIRVNSGTFTINPAGTTYVNGAAGSALDQGEWSLYHIVTATPVTGSIVMSGDVNIGHFAVYEDALTAAQIASVYDAFVGFPTVKVAEGSTLHVTGAADPVKIYAFDWSISGAG